MKVSFTGDALLIYTANSFGYYGTEASREYPNPLFIKMTRQIWKEFPNFLFLGVQFLVMNL
jgi:hypothetical protein